jgi:PAS domain S-box-containing protein
LTSETTFPQPDGAGQLEYTLSPLRAADGSVEAVIALARDVTERKRLFQVLLTVREINAVIVVEKDSEQLLQQVADILLRVRHYQRVWVGLSRSGYSQLATTTDARLDVSALGEDDAYLYDLTNSVIRTGQPEVLRHAQSDSDTTRLPRGYGSVVALPIAHPGRLFGVLCAYAAAPDTFDSEEVNMLSEIAAELAAALQSIEDEKARKRAEESLHQNAKRFSALIENSTDTVALIDADSVVTYISPAVSHTLGYLPRQVIGQPLANYVHPTERQQVVDSFAEMARHPRKVMMRRLRLRHADGSWRWIEAAVNNLLADPNVRSVVVNFRDISNRMHAEGDLRLNEARYRALVEDQPGLVCRFAPGGILTFVNEAYCRYFDKTREELVGHSFMSLIYEKDRATVERLLASLSHDNPIGVLRYRVVAAGGEVRWQQWLNRAILDSHGVVVEFQSVGHDVAQGKRRGRVPGNPQKRR